MINVYGSGRQFVKVPLMPSNLSEKGAPMDTEKLSASTMSLSPQYLHDSAKLNKSDAMQCQSSTEVVTLSPSNWLSADIHRAKISKSNKTSMNIVSLCFIEVLRLTEYAEKSKNTTTSNHPIPSLSLLSNFWPVSNDPVTNNIV